MTIQRNTALGPVMGNERETCFEFLGIKFANAGRFEYASPVERWNGLYDATHFGPACCQTRTWFEHLEVPERMFYHREFRDGIHFDYSEDALNLNIYLPKKSGKYPVIIFFHGGGFNSGASSESSFDGAAFAERGIVLVTAQYRVGVLGYLTHNEIKAKYGREGNFGLDDQFTAIRWVKEHIEDFCGNPENITLMGQSAGAISVQYLCLSPKCRGLFQRAIMASGGGLFPRFALPRKAESTREYWLELMKIANCENFSELQSLPPKKLFAALEELKSQRKDSTYNTMPVVDGYLIEKPVEELIFHPLPVDYLLGYTNNDMYAALMAFIAHRYAKQTNAYLYYFDVDAPGEDHNAAFHSSDLRYLFGTLSESFRPYGEKDKKIAGQMEDYISNFARSGDPNGENLPQWECGGKKALRISEDSFQMAGPQWGKLTWNMLTKGEPK